MSDSHKNSGSGGYVEPLCYHSNEYLAGDESSVAEPGIEETSMSHFNLNSQGYIPMKVPKKNALSRHSLH